MKRYLAFLLLLLFACKTPEMPQQPVLKPIEDSPPAGYTTTVDGQTIAYSIYPAEAGSPAVILLHMLRRTRTDWDGIAKWLQKNGYSVITIDSRGHGQSTGNWEQFTPEDFNKMVNDVAAAKSVLEAQQADVSRLAIIGASIGANTALNYGVTDPDVKTVVLLSPGLDFRGVKTEATIAQFKHPLLVVASEDDKYSADSSKELASKNPLAKPVMYQNVGHGTNMFAQKELAPTILDWLNKNV